MSKQAKRATGWGRAGYDPKEMADLALKFPKGTRVKYIGNWALKHQGKVGTVIGYVDANGLKLRYDDGSPGTSIPRHVELVPSPNLAPN